MLNPRVKMKIIAQNHESNHIDIQIHKIINLLLKPSP